MNLVALIGNLATDPELRHTPNGRAICTFRVAVSRPGGDQADFFTVVAWERQAEVCAEYLKIGRRVAVEGRMHHSTWEVEGARRSKVEVVAHRVELLGRPRTEAEAAAGDAADATAAADEDPFAVAGTPAEERELAPA